jgi:hypothetical protein
MAAGCAPRALHIDAALLGIGPLLSLGKARTSGSSPILHPFPNLRPSWTGDVGRSSPNVRTPRLDVMAVDSAHVARLIVQQNRNEDQLPVIPAFAVITIPIL